MSPTQQRREKPEEDFRLRDHEGITVFEPPVDDLGKTEAAQVAPVIAASSFIAVQAPEEPWKPINPFGEDAKAMDITVPVNTSQLQDEIAERVGGEVFISVCSEHDGPISEDNPGTLFYSPADLDGRTVRGAVESHEPDPMFGASASNRAAAALRERLASGDGKALTAQELTDGLAALLGVTASAEA